MGYYGLQSATCSRPATRPVCLSNRRTAGCANQPLLLPFPGLGVTVARIFSAAFRSAFATNPHSSQTYSPRSTRFPEASIPHAQHVFDVRSPASSTRSTVIPRSSALHLIIQNRGEYLTLQGQDESDNDSTIHRRWQGWIFHRFQPEPLEETPV